MKKLKALWQPLLFSFLFLLSVPEGQSQTISTKFFGQNAWMPDTIGNASNCTDPPCILYGKLHKRWSEVGQSGAQSVRFGGIAADRNMPTNYQYIKMIDSIRAKGMEPIIQVPFHNNKYNASHAAALVQYINGTRNRNIKYWIIANEPDLEYGYTSASQVAPYIKAYASAMKAVDPTIVTIGPETSWYHNNIINALTTPGGPYDITGKDAAGRYYIDIVSFHAYAYNGSQTRAAMISKLKSPGGFDDDMADLNNRLAACNSYHNRTGTAALKAAVTEANVNYQNASTDNLYGTGVNSFIGGQFVAEMYGLGMQRGLEFLNMWSVVEGNNTQLNIGYIEPSTGNKKPAYYHFQMMAQHFKGSSISAVSTNTNVKIFASKSSQSITVMVLNEDLAANLPFNLKLSTSAGTGTAALKLNVNAAVSQEYNDVINNQSTLLLVFNPQGVLVKKVSYGLASHAVSNLAPTVTHYNPVVQNTTPPVNQTPATNLLICSGKSSTLAANAGTSAVTWYAGASGGSALGTGTVFVTPALAASGNSSTVTYYAAQSGTITRTPITVTVHAVPVIAAINTVICQGASYTLNASGAGSYTYSSGSPIVNPSSTTAYTITGSNAAGCISAPAVAVVSVAPGPVVTAASGSICEGSSFVINPSGAATYTYSGGSRTVTPQTNTTYTVTGSNAAGCKSAPVLVTVTVHARPVISVNSGTICPGSTFTLQPGGANTYTVHNAGFVVSPSSSTVYQVSGTSAQGCVSASSASAQVQVSANAPLSVNSGTICKGESFTLTPGGATSYTYSSGSPVVKPDQTSTYTIAGSTASGCGGVAVATITVVNPIPVTVNSGSICPGQSFTMLPAGAQNYTFSSGTSVVSPSVTSSYTVYGKSSAGCIGTMSAVAHVAVSPKPVITAPNGTVCPGSAFVMQPSGAASYTYSGGSQQVYPQQNSTYTITGANALGCVSAPVVISVSVASNPTVNVTSSAPKLCSGASATLTASGAGSYSWSSGETGASIIVAPFMLTTYTVTGTNAFGCEGSTVFEQIVEVCSGIGESLRESAFTAYPNPTAGELNLVLPQQSEILIYSTSGILLKSYRYNAGRQVLMLSDLPSGIYIVKARTADREESIKIIRN